MSNELIISSSPEGNRIALLQDKKIIELHDEAPEKGNNFNVNDIYLGIVKKVNPGLNAAFIDIGSEKDAFLHYLDLGPQIKSLNKLVRMLQANKPGRLMLEGFKSEPDIDKLGKMPDVLQKGQYILTQVVKEPISSKGPRLTCEISLAGRYIVLVPFSNSVSISKKVVDKEERNRLVKLMHKLRPANFGIIIRTVAENKDEEELERDLKTLIEKWELGVEKLQNALPGERIIGEVDKASGILRDILNANFDQIITDDKDTFEQLKLTIRSIAPEQEKIVKLHNSKVKLFEHLGLEKQLKTLFGKTVSLPGGGYLVIEHTEALHVIDVNSGSASTRGSKNEDQEATGLKVNMDAAVEVARQLRLRDMGGIIVIDFIDLRRAEHKRLLYERMKEEMATDRAKHTILQLSKFGLMQITRQRVRPEKNISTVEVCPTCNGTGEIQASIAATDLIEENLELLLTKQNEKGVRILLHPYLQAYYTKGLISRQVKWLLKYKTWVRLTSDTSLGLFEFKFVNASGDEIELKS